MVSPTTNNIVETISRVLTKIVAPKKEMYQKKLDPLYIC